jgi:ATP-dependent Clp protease protease subunit
MKKNITILTLILLFSFSVFAFAYQEEDSDPGIPKCPVTLISDNKNCMDCHVLKTLESGKVIFGIKELAPDANYSAHPASLEIKKDCADNSVYAYIKITETNARKFRDAADYLYWHPEIKRLVVELHSGGGSIMDAWNAIGAIKEMQSRGIVVETRCYGLAASAAAVLLVAGDMGHRFVNEHAEIMIHKVWTFTMFDLKTPDSAEDQAATLKHFQENINGFILSRTKITKEQLDTEIYKRDFWMTGKEAVEKWGVADGFVK